MRLTLGRARVFAGLLLAGLALIAVPHSARGDVHSDMALSLVHLRIEAIDKLGNPKEGKATGFLVTADGQVLTVYHLISGLGEVVVETVKITARVGRRGVNPTDFTESAAVVTALPELDLLLLKISQGQEAYKPVRLGASRTLALEAPLLTSGFPENLDLWPDDGALRSKQGPGGTLWGTDMEFLGGQSGSPIYLNTGEVVGVVKGQLIGASNKSFFIPIDLADPLLIPLRLEAIWQRLRAVPKGQCRVCVSATPTLCAGNTQACSDWSTAGALTGADPNSAGWSEPIQIIKDTSAGFADCKIRWKVECQ
ncbi:serine protease [Mesorhizobium sp.]|uniref:S1 family peptidase n=1 Tax=Mesorhizobium sp. TaxID=1871066 RepID=UPI000FE8104B|nr:serine protease [Mesorhizobium sp.]RWO88573.1 MAG: serine protease [Mesorhizobium sp.]